MFLTPFSALLGIVSALAGVSAAHPGQLQDRAATASSNFSIFAYGSDPDTTIGGYPIFYNDGMTPQHVKLASHGPAFG